MRDEGPPDLGPLGLGGCPLGGHGWGAYDQGQAEAAILEAYDRGVRHFDTADVYGLGHSERLLAQVLGPRMRDVVVASKFGIRWDDRGRTSKDTSPGHLRSALDASLRRLRLERIDLYYVHWPDGRTPIDHSMSELERCREAGKIRWIGLSNHSAEEVGRAAEVARVDALQVRYSLVDREAAEGLAPVAAALRIPMVTWGSLAQGLLTGKFDAGSTFGPDDRRARYDNFQGDRFVANLRAAERVREVARRTGRSPAQVALGWVLCQPGVGTVLFGAKRPAQVADNVGARDACLAPADLAFLVEGAPADAGAAVTEV